MTPEKARQILLTDNMTFGVIMVKANDADGMVAGACHATADTLASGAADFKDRTRCKAGIRFLYSGCTQLWVEARYVPVCRLWPESDPTAEELGTDCRHQCKEL